MAILPFSRAPKPRNCRFVFGENHPPQMRAISCIGAGTGPDLSQRREQQGMEALRRDDGNHRAQMSLWDNGLSSFFGQILNILDIRLSLIRGAPVSTVLLRLRP